MHSSLIALVERILLGADRSHPADALLREELKAARGLYPEDPREITRAVFSYFRWLGWLEQKQPLPDQVMQALSLADQFARTPNSFSEADLLARTIPSWVSTELDLTADWVRSLQNEPKLWLRARRGQGDALSAQLGDCYAFGPDPLAEILEYRGVQDLFRTPQFHEGSLELQDINSQAVGLLCAPQPGETWWDACAGEGGKTMHLSDLMENKGLIWASDRAGWRLQHLKRRAGRAKVFNYRAVPWDGGAKPPTKTKFDGVLVDAPCSGLGTWQRNPHARWTTQPQDVRELAQLQLQILSHAAPSVKPGGKLVYAVCTLTRAETTDLVSQFSRQFADFEPLPAVNPFLPDAPPASSLFLWPQFNQGNGMFIALWRRKNTR
jgi:16S rRNA (cytosine967-C5)-methyltransferase